jgi:hypothetical protein
LASWFFILGIVPLSLVAQNISIEDFRIPETKYQRFLGGLSGSWNKSDQKSIYNANGSSYGNSNSSDAQAQLNYIMNNFNEDYSFQVSLSAGGNASMYTYDENQDNISSTFSKRSQYVYALNFLPNIHYSKYLTPDSWYWYGEGNGYYSYQDSRNTEINNYNGPYNDSTYIKFNTWSASLGFGVGYGKMRDGFAIFGVLRILDKLTEDSLFVRSLTNEEILRLVAIFARKEEYQYSQEKYVKYFMDDLFSALQNMGVLKNNAPLPYSIARAIEVLSEQIEPRLFGWRVQLGLQKNFEENSTFSDYNHDNFLFRSYTWNSRNYFKLSTEFGHALSLNLHMHSVLSIYVPEADAGRKTDFNFQIAGIYQVGERIDASLAYVFSRTHTVNEFYEDNFSRRVNNELFASLRFYIENNVSFVVAGRYAVMEQQGYSPYGSWKSIVTTPQISFGINYRFF